MIILSSLKLADLFIVHWAFRRIVGVAPRRWRRKLKRLGQVWWSQLGPCLLRHPFCLIDTPPYPKMKIRSNSMMDLTAVFGRHSTDSVMEIIQALSDDAVFVDIGAYIGRYTLAAAKVVFPKGQVLAVEPDFENYQLLVDNIALNHWQGQVKTHCVAVGDRETTVHLHHTVGTSTHTIIDTWFQYVEGQINRDHRIESVPMKTIDLLFRFEGLEYVDLLKIDVEGAELLVLWGATEFLQSGRIGAIICEVHEPVISHYEVESLLREAGYKLNRLGFGQLYALR